jgi:nucleotidyltransferase substrate binding protein (TIGR01987 family)
MIHINALELALKKLDSFVALSKSHHSDRVTQQAIETACIQAFEYTYEIAHKMLKRYLEATEANKEEMDALSFQDLIRRGFERGLLKNSWQQWKIFREARNKTSHSYNEAFMQEILAIIPAFRIEAHFLISQINERQTKN